MMNRLWTQLRNLWGERCEACRGKGYRIGFSPFDSLATIRRAEKQYCGYCRGEGSTTREINQKFLEVERKNEAYFERLRFAELARVLNAQPVEQIPD